MIEDHVIQLCTQEMAVYCFDFDGNPNFQYRESDLLYPGGVALDRDGNIYVCVNHANAIFVLSPSGGFIKF